MEERDEEKEKVIDEKQYYDLEEVPEPLRAALQERVDAARAAGADKPAETEYKMVMQQDLQFHSPVLDAVLKFLIRLAPPPPQSPRPPKPTGFATPEERSAAGSDLPQPGAITPSSSGMFVWVILIGLAAFYWFYSSVK